MLLASLAWPQFLYTTRLRRTIRFAELSGEQAVTSGLLVIQAQPLGLLPVELSIGPVS